VELEIGISGKKRQMMQRENARSKRKQQAQTPNWGLSSAALIRTKREGGARSRALVTNAKTSGPQVTQWSLPFLDQLNKHCPKSGNFAPWPGQAEKKVPN
jgi:hypothetical protein